ncbi:MAG TPA: thioredoxin domain-containing protein [Gemmatimonadales bacterium]|nr:thioredoxin domain-containing protein [Gemmatimonadales bacterium]
MSETHALVDPVSGSDHTDGLADAAITLVEYGDFECPFCREAYPIVKEVRRRLGSRLRFVWRSFPLKKVHEHAEHAAEVAEAAAAQGKFWPMHDRLFERQFALDDEYLIEYAGELGLDADRVARELDAGTYADTVRASFIGGIKSGVNKTPSFFINGERYDGKWDLETLTAALCTNSKSS